MNISELMKESAVLIPALQRNYVHGRDDEHAKEVREHFVDSVLKCAQGKGTMHLDLVYGVKEKGVFVPIDGQQRLTTLWLMAVYSVKRCSDKSLSEQDRVEILNELSRFSYEARPIAATFCHWLTSACKFGTSELDCAEREWGDDPTVRAMITTLRTIEEKANENVVDQVVDAILNRVTFDFRPVSGDATDLYVKVNARGKTLTQWENLKGKFADALSPESKKRFEDRIEGLSESYFKWATKSNESERIPDSSFFALFGRIADYWLRMNKVVPAMQKDGNQRENLSRLASETKLSNLPYVPVEEFELGETAKAIVEPLCRLMKWALEHDDAVVNYWNEKENESRTVAQMVFAPKDADERDFSRVLFEYFSKYDLNEGLTVENYRALRLIANVLENVSRGAVDKNDANGTGQFNRVEGLKTFIEASPRLYDYSQTIKLESAPLQYWEEFAKARVYAEHPKLIAALQDLEVAMHGRCRLALLELSGSEHAESVPEKLVSRLSTLKELFSDWQNPGKRLELAQRVIRSEPLQPKALIRICYEKFPDERLREWLSTSDDAELQRTIVDGEPSQKFDKCSAWCRDWRETVCAIMGKEDGFQDKSQDWRSDYADWSIRQHKPSGRYYLYYGGNLHNALPVSDWRYELYRKDCRNEFSSLCNECGDVLMNDGDTHSCRVNGISVYFYADRIELRRYQTRGDRAVVVQGPEEVKYGAGKTAHGMLQELQTLLQSEKWRTE